MNFLIIIFLIILGIVLLLIEVTILPGITVAGVGSFLVLVYSVYLAFTDYGSLVGFGDTCICADRCTFTCL